MTCACAGTKPPTAKEQPKRLPELFVLQNPHSESYRVRQNVGRRGHAIVALL
jgi:hypothetical protein